MLPGADDLPADLALAERGAGDVLSGQRQQRAFEFSAVVLTDSFHQGRQRQPRSPEQSTEDIGREQWEPRGEGVGQGFVNERRVFSLQPLQCFRFLLFRGACHGDRSLLPSGGWHSPC